MAKEKSVSKKEVRMEGAPDWYGTPLDELEFEWSYEEKLEIERYCEKILKNVEDSGEEMTPIERWKAHMAGKPKDRILLAVHTKCVYAARTLDSHTDAVKPIDVFRNPKLLVKALLATVARYKLDYPQLHVTSYTEELWGGRAKMIDYGNPCPLGDPPKRTLENLEDLEVPDPRKDGLFPGWIWTHQELRRIIDKYRLPIPIWASIGCDPTGLCLMGIMGWTPLLRALRKDQELARRCSNLGFQFDLKVAQALIEVSRPEGIYMDPFIGMWPLTGNEWIADELAEFAKALKAIDPNVHRSYSYPYFTGFYEWLDIMHERGALSQDTFDGGTGGLSEDIDMKSIFDWHRDHNLHLSYTMRDRTLQKGPISAIEEEVKAMCELGKSHHRFAPGFNPPYFTPPAYLDAAVAALKKYGKY